MRATLLHTPVSGVFVMVMVQKKNPLAMGIDQNATLLIDPLCFSNGR